LRTFPVVALLDPRQAGKSTLVTMLADEGRERYPLDARIEVIPFIEAARPYFRWAAASG
jgi:predicted AAA+ superfamily ATPase